MGCRPRARSALHCHGGLALRGRPLGGALLAVQEGGRMEGLRLVSRQFRKQRLAVWAAGRGPDPHFTAMVFWLCETGQCRKAGEWKVCIVSRQFRKQRLAVWAAGRGPDPHFTAMVFWLCETVLWHGASPAVQEGGRKEGLRLASRQFRESNVWQYGLPAAGPIRTSLPWCFGSARPSFERSFAGSAGRRANGRSETSFYRQFRKQRLAEWAAGCGLDPHFTAMVFWLCETVLWAELCRQCRMAGEWKVWD